MLLNSNTVFYFPKDLTSGVSHAIGMLKRDFKKVFSAQLIDTSDPSKANIIVDYDDTLSKAEQFQFVFKENLCYIYGADELGIIYGLLTFTEKYLGVDPFWFWADKEPEKHESIDIEERNYISPVAKVRYRGWFVNDEVCLIGWSEVYPPSRQVWECVFETLLRCGGNMVIPGTDLPREGNHFEIATEMGLYITHHHAEPLGSEMFLRAYPDKDASYDKHPDLFEKLWEEAIVKNKEKKIVWTLGFRGQGDAPFWHNDPSYTTPESRAGVIRKVIDKQYEILTKYVQNPVCAVYLYGEITELYKGSYLTFPDGFIKIWADNGYGKMVVRRSGNHNPRTYSLPVENEAGPHGLYYHATFHDLQASSHLTLLSNPPEMVNDELDKAFIAGADTFLLVNSGNIRMHVYMLDAIRKIWTSGKINIDAFKLDFGKRLYPNRYKEVLTCYDDYFKSMLKYGVHEDDMAGDEFFHHNARTIMTCWVRGLTKDNCARMLWATADVSFDEQVNWFKNVCQQSLDKLNAFKQQCTSLSNTLSGPEKVFFDDNLKLAAILHHSGCKGMITLCDAYEAFKANNLITAFVLLSRSMKEYSEGLNAMKAAEHTKWKNFYSADYLTNVEVTIYSLDSTRKYIRMLGDSPNFFAWYKNFVIPKTERKIYLENTQRRTLSDDELASCLANELNILL